MNPDPSTAVAADSTTDRAHDAWMDDFFASYYAHRPVNATFIGVHEHDHRLPDFSEAAVGDVLAEGEDLATRAAPVALDPAPTLDRARAIDRRLALGFLRIQKWELESEHFHRGNPALYTGEAIFGVIGLLLTDFAPMPERAEAAIARLHAIPALLAQAAQNVRAAPPAWTARAIRECDGALALFSHLGSVPWGTAARNLRPRLDRAAAEARRAFADHRAWLDTDLLHRPCGNRACGAEAFDTILREGHFISEPADEIVRYADEALAEAEARLREGAAKHGAASPEEALAGLAALHPTADGYYARYQEVWDETRRIAERESLLTWPDFPIRYVPRREWVRAAAPHLYFLFYRSPAAFQRPPVHEYLVAPLPDAGEARPAFLRANNDSVIKLNHVIHHGGMGHHVQNWHAFRARSRIGRIAAVDCASRIAMTCGGTMAEGWACYATDLAAEAGMLTPLERYAELNGRVRMAARALVDVRLHRGEITLDEASAFYQARAGMTTAAARAEAVKNEMFPGGAVMYLMGSDAIHRLRTEVHRRSGAAFDLLRFHDAFLSYGSIPVTLIAEEMTRDDDARDDDA